MSQHRSHSHFIQTQLLQLSLVWHWQKTSQSSSSSSKQMCPANSKTTQSSRTHASPLLQSLHWLPIEKRILFKLIVQAFKAFQFSSPGYLASYFQSRVHKTKYSLRSDLAITFEVPRAKKQAGDRAFSVAGPHLWNGLPSSVRTVDHMDRFKNKLKSHLFSWFFQVPWAHCKRRYINHIIVIIIIITQYHFGYCKLEYLRGYCEGTLTLLWQSIQ